MGIVYADSRTYSRAIRTACQALPFGESCQYVTWISFYAMLPLGIQVMQEADVIFRHASPKDLSAIASLLADDPLGAKREAYTAPLPESYDRAFEAIDRDPSNEVVVAEFEGRVIGVLQLTVIPNIAYRGSWRAQIEGVRIAAELRSSGIGRKLFEWAIDRARRRGCHLVQLTTDKARPDAIRFYDGLVFVASHEGMKLHLELPERPQE